MKILLGTIVHVRRELNTFVKRVRLVSRIARSATLPGLPGLFRLRGLKTYGKVGDWKEMGPSLNDFQPIHFQVFDLTGSNGPGVGRQTTLGVETFP